MKSGILLCFENGECINFEKEHIKQLADELWNNPSKLPANIRNNDTFKTCTICPFRGKDVFCSAMKPIIPFLEKFDSFQSHNKVTVKYFKDELTYSIETTMQNALQYIVNLSLFEYCEDTKKYHKYFRGITPFMDFKEAIARIYLNVFWFCKGDYKKTDELINELKEAVNITSKSCIDRISLLTRSDAFLNAYVRTQTITQILALKISSVLDEYLKDE